MKKTMNIFNLNIRGKDNMKSTDDNMITGLEALKELKKACATHMGRMVYILQEDKFETIEKELKENKAREKRYDELLYTLNDINNERVDLLQVKKAVDLIKEKKVNCYLFINSENLKDYNGCVDDITEKRLIQDEYDLLKEVLL